MRSAYIYILALVAGALATPVIAEETTPNLLPREAIDGDIICEGFDLAPEEAPRSSMNEGIDYLRKLTEDGKICGAHKKECSRVSCSWSAAVYLCNDTDEDQNNVECKAIAESVERLFYDCNIRHYPNRNRVRGYQKGPGGLSVHVGRNEC